MARDHAALGVRRVATRMTKSSSSDSDAHASSSQPSLADGLRGELRRMARAGETVVVRSRGRWRGTKATRAGGYEELPDEKVDVGADRNLAQVPVRPCECHEQPAKGAVYGNLLGAALVVLEDLGE